MPFGEPQKGKPEIEILKSSIIAMARYSEVRRRYEVLHTEPFR
jgi:hypothetical protein